MNRLRRVFPLIFLLIIYPVLKPLLDLDFFIAHDVFFHITHLHQFERALSGGAIYPRWYPDVFEGYGAPVGVFYPQLPYYVAEIPRLFGAGILLSWRCYVGAAFLFSGFFQFLWARRLFGDAAGWVAAVAYVYYPYHIADAYVRGAFPELLGFVWFPLVAWGMHSLAADPGPRRIALAALPTGALALTHFPSTVLFLPVAAGIGVVSLVPGKRRRGILSIATALTLGIGIAGMAWLPFAAELDQVGLSQKSQDSFVQFENHFVSPGQILSRYWGFGASLPPAFEDGMSFQVGWVHLGLGILGVAALLRSRERRRLGILLGLLAILGLFMMLRPSDFLWRAIPVIRQVQFPWRVLAPLGFVFATLAGAAVAREAAWLPRKPPWVATAAPWVAGGLVVAFSLPYCVASYYDRPVDPARYPGAYRGPSLWPWELVEWSTSFLLEKDLQKIAYEDPYYLPMHRFPREEKAIRRSPLGERVEPLGEEWIIEEVRQRPGSIQFLAGSRGGVEVLLDIFRYPGWKATIDGLRVETRLHEETGGMLVAVPPGRHAVHLWFGTTPPRVAGGLLSSASILGAVLLLLVGRRRLSMSA